MTKEIKQRIEQIKNGEVPRGYKKTKIGIVPNEWEVKTLGEVGEFKKGREVSKNNVIDDGLPAMMYGDIYIKYNIKFDKVDFRISEETAKKSTAVYKGDLLFTCSGETALEIGKCVCYIGDEIIYIGGDIVAISVKDYNSLFIAYQQNTFQSIKEKARLGQGHSVVHIYSDMISKLNICLPPLREQQKITDILSTQDKLIELKEKLLKEKEKQKKYLMQNLLTGRKRLKGFVGEWKKVKLGKCLVEKSDKTIQKNQYPVLTSSRKGIFLQNQYFNKSVSSEDNIGYKILRKNEFTYRTMSDDGKYTFNLLEEYEIGIVSPAYSVFNVNSDKCEIKFLYYLLNDFSFNKYIMKLIQGGTRLALRYSELCKLEIKLPPLEEQKAIAEILTTADKELKLLQEELEEEKRKKKALMQLLLTGIVRVKV